MNSVVDNSFTCKVDRTVPFFVSTLLFALFFEVIFMTFAQIVLQLAEKKNDKLGKNK